MLLKGPFRIPDALYHQLRIGRLKKKREGGKTVLRNMRLKAKRRRMRISKLN
ncbi:hypothetical protein BT69DRAFT_1287047 [Atractiella rhizophila]|nr:hypothetical protein BT69DRAFT_1287047 [Atractiella rhizophila]